VMPTDRTTVVIATRDRCAELLETVHRLLTLHREHPIIVVDNASRDGTFPAVQSVREALDRPDRLRAIRLRRNDGAAARTVGARLADTEFVAFCDDDSWWVDDSLSRAEALFDHFPTVGLIAAAVTVMPSGRPDPMCEQMAHSPLGHAPGLPGPSVLGFLACSAIVRRHAFLEAGGFSRLLHFAGEETLLAWDLAAAGWDLCFVDEVQMCHQPSQQRAPAPARIRRELRNATLTTLLRRPPGRCGRAMGDVVRRVLRTPSMLPVVPELVVRTPAVLRGRRRVPNHIEERIRMLEGAETAR
jgi:glycosyltransferase involved in cell wall biosynthesis